MHKHKFSPGSRPDVMARSICFSRISQAECAHLPKAVSLKACSTMASIHLVSSNSMLVPIGVRKGKQKELMSTKLFPKARELVHSDFEALILN